MIVYKCLGNNRIFYSLKPKGKILVEIDVEDALLDKDDLEFSVESQEFKNDLESVGIYL